jgi:lipoyl(octanoyl) transferase
MSAPTDCVLLDERPQAGAWNMAVDEALLEWSAETGRAAIRFYRWAEPTLSLGYFQPIAARRVHTASRDGPAVRRLTGGGAIVHDRELTYSLVVPASHPAGWRRAALYEAVHGALVEALAGWGIRASLCPAGPSGRADDEPFLCFQRRAPGDVLVGGVKVAGSAQRRRRGAVLQHGSVLLGRSAAAPELPGLGDLGGPADAPGAAMADAALAAAWLEPLARRLALRWVEWPGEAGLFGRARRLVDARYAAPAWTDRF